DIHAGGIDLQFPHHENEIAQSECAHGGKVFARFWLHNGMLNFAGSKMSKSIGNIEKVHDLLRDHPPEALRYALLSAHYRQPLEWSEALIEQSVRTLDRLYGTLRALAGHEVQPAIPDAIEAALDDDLNTPQALAVVSDLAKSARNILAHAPDGGGEAATKLASLKSGLLGAGFALGLLQQPPSDWFARGAGSGDDARIQSLVAERNLAKQTRDFARADAIRRELADDGILLEDTAAGVRWRRE
ncbi:MAG: class I tRNA ligase family protein, partial [Lysobacter sp.]|nr:class I tRNA ligase family protein [Lysobacter sp.]